MAGNNCTGAYGAREWEPRRGVYMPGGDHGSKQPVSGFHIFAGHIWSGRNHRTCCGGAASIEECTLLEERSLSLHKAQSAFSGRPHSRLDNHDDFLGGESRRGQRLAATGKASGQPLQLGLAIRKLEPTQLPPDTQHQPQAIFTP